MDVTLTRKVLLDLLAKAVPIVPAKPGMPILSNVLFAADFGTQTLTVKSTDLVVSFTGSRPATVRKPGSVCVPAVLTRAIVSKLPEGDVTITDERGRVALRSKGARRADSLVSIPGEDWPSTPEITGEAYTIPAESLADVRRLTRDSQSTDDTRPHLAATLFTLQGETLRAVATEGHRLAMASRDVPGMKARNLQRPGSPLSLLVPSVSLARLTLPETGEVRLAAARNEGPLSITDVATGDTWSMKLVDAAFPSYEQVIPASHVTSITCDRAALLESLSAVATVALDRTSGVRFAVRDGVLTLSASNPDAGDMSDTVDVTVEGPQPPAWGMNSRYVEQTLRALQGERVVLLTSGELDPITVRCPTEGDAFTGVIMPMRI
jgi:DNA polymerase-3 subunit beta